MAKKTESKEIGSTLSGKLKSVREAQSRVNDICADYPNLQKRFDTLFGSLQDQMIKDSEKKSNATKVNVAGEDRPIESYSADRYVKGNKGLAGFFKVSLATASKLSKSGKYNAAKIKTGERSVIWDTFQLKEIARVR